MSTRWVLFSPTVRIWGVLRGGSPAEFDFLELIGLGIDVFFRHFYEALAFCTRKGWMEFGSYSDCFQISLLKNACSLMA